ncbi:3-isopropylmalate dehydratase small subunit [Rossellomorea marisflavi]|uniref:3-isopropylmalate dehydratase small subunit n=1 Tax=Rossellomorea marisflavi TaxID=189381 RepID=UPI0025C85964|nr:3-isopropylmalate dehydratase small subunit [Rossellomorea marisflavi]UTE72497.1 3-isopropylmalate dehydratase small subunit [Rossellomorea marisflavi]GLI86335.1 3-isopropylmalate dehydratase small subunit [Rossellomorea marisflavi]
MAINHVKESVFPLHRDHVDTDQIIPKQFLKRIERQGFGQFLFYHWRFEDDGKTLRKGFLLDTPTYKDAGILIGGKNFGCGSSREHAPWALQDFGFKVVIAKSFADIFHNNCLKNGILPIRLDDQIVDQLWANERKAEPYEIEISLEDQTIKDSEGLQVDFSIDSYWKNMLIKGLDEIGLTLEYGESIDAYEKKYEVSSLGI